MYSFQLSFLIFVAAGCAVSSTWSKTVNGIFSARSMAPISEGFNSQLAESVSRGAQIAIDQCQSTFKWDRWNCPESAFVRRQKNQPATKETAYIHAILSAGVTYSVTRNCSRGNIVGCGCDPRFGNTTLPSGREPRDDELKEPHEDEPVDWTWGGCSEHVHFGQQVSRSILDQMERGRDLNAYIHLHNNLVGRTVVRESMVKKCRCHGVSGSCSMQTCWMQLAPFSEVATRLRQMYDSAEKVDYEGGLGNSASVNIIAEKILSDEPRNLVYTRKSPNYCKPNNAIGWPGTKGRACSHSKQKDASLAEKKSCKTLCHSCGHCVRKEKRQVKKRCNCSFKWCCEVKCDICTETIEEYFCD